MNVYEILQVGEGVTLSIYRLDIISCSLKSVFKFEKRRTVVVREEFQFSDLRCFRNTALDCFLSHGGWKLFTARRDNPICSCCILFYLAFTRPASFCDTVKSVSVRSIRTAFGRQAVYERGETIAFQSTNSHRRTFNAN